MSKRCSPFGPTPKPALKGVHPFVKFLDEHRTMTLTLLGEKAGIDYKSINRWRLKGHPPRLADIEAVLNVLGYDLVLVKRNKG